MVLLLLLWAITVAAALPLGAACIRLAAPLHSMADAEDRFVVCAWCGLFMLGSLLLALSLAAPLAPPYGAGAAALAAGGCMASRAVRTELRSAVLPPASAAALAVIALAGAFEAGISGAPGDTGLYHYPLMRWLADAGTVPGMALVHYRFGFSSGWLALAAALDFGPWSAHTAPVTGGLAFTLVAFHLAMVAPRALRSEAAIAERFLSVAYGVLIATIVGQSQEGSASPNMAPAIAVVLCVWTLLHASREHSGSWNLSVVLAAGGVSVKLVAAPALAVALAARWLSGSPRRAGAALLVVALLLVAPLLLANRVASGCWFFPIALGCSDTASGVGSRMAATLTSDALNWARYPGVARLGAPFASLDWFASWAMQPKNAAFLGALALGVAALWRTRAQRWALAVGLAGTTYFLVAAPDLRFAAGYVAALIGLAAASASWPIPTWARDLGPRASTVAVSAFIFCLAFAQARNLPQGDVVQSSLMPRALPIANTRERVVNAIRYRITSGTDECWATPRPCTPYEPAASVRLCDERRGERGGFCR